VNTVYLKAGWQVTFDANKTRDRTFTLTDGSTIDVPTMVLDGGQEVPYATGSGWKATELRYVGAKESTPLAMTLIVPTDIDAFEAGLTWARLTAITGKLDAARSQLSVVTQPNDPGACASYPYSVRLSMPRFGVDTRADLVPALKALGMQAAFAGGAADFSGISTQDRLSITSVIHQANIDVDEDGTEAAAATAVVMGDTAGPCAPQPAKTVTLRLDRPFLFQIRDVDTGAILFMGRVLDPSARG
jgi:serpin B